MNSRLVDWDIAFTDHWDGRGHFTKDTGEFPCVCGLASHLMAYLNIGIKFCETVAHDDDTDYRDIFRSLSFLGMASFAAKEGIDIDDIFDNDTEQEQFAEEFEDRCFSAVYHKMTAERIEELLADSLEGYF